MSQPPLVPCPACRRHIQAGSAVCPFCAAAGPRLGPGFGHPDDASAPPPPAPTPLRPEATLYGLAPLPRQLPDTVPMPAYGMAPYTSRPRTILVMLVAMLIVVAVGVAAFLVLRAPG